jgi:hypothetical protein
MYIASFVILSFTPEDGAGTKFANLVDFMNYEYWQSQLVTPSSETSKPVHITES